VFGLDEVLGNHLEHCIVILCIDMGTGPLRVPATDPVLPEQVFPPGNAAACLG
jgi:hypothetical protein